MRSILAAAFAATMTLSTAFAAEPAALTPGKPAGVKQADIEAGGVWLVVGILVVAGAIAAIASSTQGNSAPAATSTSTAP